MRRNYIIWAIVIVIIIALILWLFKFGGWEKLTGSGAEGNKTENTLNQEARDRAEYEKALYNTGYNAGHNAGLEDCEDSLLALSNIRSTLACICQKTTTTTTTTQKTTPKPKPTPSDTEKKPKESFTPPDDSRRTTSSESRSLIVNVNEVLYKAIYIGDWGITLISDGEYYYPVYYISKAIYDKYGFQMAICSAARDNSLMVLSGDYYIYIDYSVKLNSGMIEDDYWRFSIYIGEYHNNGSSYSMYYPHEGVKPLLKQYLGREWGEITDEDLQMLAPYNDGIAKGSIRPNGFYSPAGADGKIYGGWEFYVRMNHEKYIL